MKKSWIRKRNPKRRKKRFDQAYHSLERVLWVKNGPCGVCGAEPSENMHIRSRAAGGTWRDVVRGCRVHHNELHQTGIKTFEERHDICLEYVAARLEREWRKQG